MDISESEWELIKKRNNGRCLNCGKAERQVGVLLRTSLHSSATGETRVIPLCMSCQVKYKTGNLEYFEMQRLSIIPEDYGTSIPDGAKLGRQIKMPPRSSGIP